MIIDKNGKLFGKINLIDLIILLVVLAGIFGVYYKFQQSATATPFSEKQKIQVTLQTDDVDNFAVDAIEVGDVVRDWQKNITLGTLKEIKVGEAKIAGFNEAGEVVLSTRDDRVSVELVFEGEGLYSPQGATSFSNNSYFINRSMEISVGDVILWIRISDIRLAE